MMSGRILALIATWLVFLPAAGAFGQGSPARAGQSNLDEARKGWYGRLSMAAATPTFERALQRKLGFNVSTNETIGFDARVGYRLHPNLAAELEVEWLNPWKVEVGTICSSPVPPTDDEIKAVLGTGVSAATFDGLPCRGREIAFPATDPVRSGDPFRVMPVAATLNGRAFLATGRWQPYLTFGSGLMYVLVDDKSVGGHIVNDVGFTLRLGGGLEYYITERLTFSLGASYVLPISGRAQDYDYVSFEPFGLGWRF